MTFLVTFVGQTALSLCGGSGSLMEAAMHLGRNCIMFGANGIFFLRFAMSKMEKIHFYLTDRQYSVAKARMQEIFARLQKMEDLTRFVIC